MLALAFALSSSLCWGVGDFIGGLQARRIPLLRVILVSQAAGLVVLVVVVAALGLWPGDWVKMLPAAAGGIAGIAALSAFYRALAIGTMSVVAPISATGVAVPVLVGVASGERPAALQLAGILAASVGVVLASRERGPGLPPTEGARASVVLALLAALGFGSFFVGVRISARVDLAGALVASRAASVAVLILAGLVLRWVREPGPSRPRPAPAPGDGTVLPALLLIGFLDLSANLLYALATRRGLLSVVAVAASLYPLTTVVLARLVLGERVRRIQEVGIAAALAGVVLIGVG
jgi:drug/metabolite transporter (DMT)-like permease